MRTYFFDTEFTGLRKDTTLISIGIVSDTGDRFYAELTDYNESMCDEWIEKNVLDHLILSGNADLEESMAADNKTTTVIGSKEDVRRELMEWLEMDPSRILMGIRTFSPYLAEIAPLRTMLESWSI